MANRVRLNRDNFAGQFHGINPDAVFYEDGNVPGISVLKDIDLVKDIHSNLGDFSHGPKDFFPVNWPYVLNPVNIHKLRQPYVVASRPVGPRYLLYIDQCGDIYLENNSQQIFQIDEKHTVHFPGKHRQPLTDTVLDGIITERKRSDDSSSEFVFVIQDSFRCCGEDLVTQGIEERLACVQKDVIEPRKEAIKRKDFETKTEAFDIDIVTLKDAVDAEEFLTETFTRNWNYKLKSLIFHPKDEPYKSGSCHKILQWAMDPSVEINFRLKIEVDLDGTEIGYLYVVGFRRCELKYTRNDEYCTLSVDDEIRKHDKRIISCRFVDDQFVFVRKRGDRNHPNSLKTIKAKLNTVENPVSKERLLSYLETRGAREVRT